MNNIDVYSVYVKTGIIDQEYTEYKRVKCSYVKSNQIIEIDLDDIKVINDISEGGFSDVYLILLDDKVKVMKTLKDYYYSEVYKEITLLNIFKHDNIIELELVLYDNNTHTHSLIFDPIDVNLDELIHDSRRISIYNIKLFSFQLFEVIKYMNELGTMHLDIKPTNILVTDTGIKLIDFGLSQPYVSSYKTKPLHVYTLWYEPIELLLKDKYYDYNADLWSCSIVLIEMLIGDMMFSSDNIAEQINEISTIIGFDNINAEFHSNSTWLKLGKYEYSKGIENIYELRIYLLSRGMSFNNNNIHMIDLIFNTVTLPSMRLNVDECLLHDWYT